MFFNIENVDVKIYLYYDDVYSIIKSVMETKKRDMNYADKIFSSSPLRVYEESTKEYTEKYIYIPHGATNDYNTQFNETPLSKVFLSGNVDKIYYPGRYLLCEISKTQKFKDKIDILDHPGYKHECKGLIGSEYAKKINEYLVSVTTPGETLINETGNKVITIISKHFEIPCTGSLLLIVGDYEEYLKEFGFENKKNCLFCKQEKVEVAKILKYIFDEKNKNEIDRIRKNGKKLILENHMSEHRMEKLNKIVEFELSK